MMQNRTGRLVLQESSYEEGLAAEKKDIKKGVGMLIPWTLPYSRQFATGGQKGSKGNKGG